MRSGRTRRAPASRATKELLARMLWNLLVATLFVLVLLWIIMGTTVVEQPMAMAAPPQPQVMAVVQPQMQMMAAPPQPQAMARAPMEGRVEEIQLGCYGQQGAPCCWLMSLSWKDSDRTVITAGPGCFCCCCCGCCPGCCGQFTAPEKGSANFKGEWGETWNFQSPTSFTMTGGIASGDTYRKMC